MKAYKKGKQICCGNCYHREKGLKLVGNANAKHWCYKPQMEYIPVNYDFFCAWWEEKKGDE